MDKPVAFFAHIYLATLTTMVPMESTRDGCVQPSPAHPATPDNVHQPTGLPTSAAAASGDDQDMWHIESVTQECNTHNKVLAMFDLQNDGDLGNADIEDSFGWKHTEGRTKEFHASTTLSASLTASLESKLQAGIPIIAAGETTGKIELNAKGEVTIGGGTSWNETTETARTTKFSCPPNKRVKVVVTQSQKDMTITVTAVHRNGTNVPVGTLVVKDGLAASTKATTYCLHCEHRDADCSCPPAATPAATPAAILLHALD